MYILEYVNNIQEMHFKKMSTIYVLQMYYFS